MRKPTPEFVMDAWNAIKDSAKSYWSSAADGGEVDIGGVGEKLLARDFDNNLKVAEKKYIHLSWTRC